MKPVLSSCHPKFGALVRAFLFAFENGTHSIPVSPSCTLLVGSHADAMCLDFGGGLFNWRSMTLNGVEDDFVFTPALTSVRSAVISSLLKIEQPLSKFGGFLRVHSGPQVGLL